jgi:translation elongation factor EF-G
MHVVIFVAQEFAARVEGGVLRHRGRIDSSEHRDGVRTIRARVPEAEVAAFVSALLADTNGRARMSMTLCEYWPVLERLPGGPTAGVREPRPNAPLRGTAQLPSLSPTATRSRSVSTPCTNKSVPPGKGSP